jgi:hypothetical protein
MIIFNCLYAIYIINYFILSPKGEGSLTYTFPGEGGGINALESCFSKSRGVPGVYPQGRPLICALRLTYYHIECQNLTYYSEFVLLH